MKKIIIIFFTVILLNSCFPFNFTQSTEKNYAQLNEEDVENIKDQIMNEIRKEILNEYFNQISEIEQKIISIVNTFGGSVLGVSNYKYLNKQYIESSTGSGVIYKYDKSQNTYYMITNEHVINDADKVRVVFEDLSAIDASIVGKDANTDLAVIKFNSTRSLPIAELGDSDNISKGQFAIAIGNPLGFEFYGSVTVGHVSGVSREVPIDYQDDGVIDWYLTLIQHDAAISPGNSGGGLFDITGKLIGINNMKIVQDTVSDIGFAIPINIVKDIIAQIEEHGEVVRPSLGITGLSVEDALEFNALIDAGLLSEEKIPIPAGITSGVYVSSIVPNSSASNSDLQQGDIIVKYNDDGILVFDDLRIRINNAKIGEKINLTVYRDGEYLEISLTLIKRPDIE